MALGTQLFQRLLNTSPNLFLKKVSGKFFMELSIKNKEKVMDVYLFNLKFTDFNRIQIEKI